MTLPEVLLWNLLRKAPDGVIFRRQHPVAGFVVDFYCAKARACIEIDGIAHDRGDIPDRDAKRDATLREAGLDIIRVPAQDVLNSPGDVAEALIRRCSRE